MSSEGRERAKGLAKAFQRMSRPANKGGTGGTFTAAATKAGHADSPEGRKAFASEVLENKGRFSPKMVKKANFYRNVIAR
jgi:hypothetical protein